jgi:hypothetical protein
MHDWGDEDCIRILKNARAAVKPGGRIVILDQVRGVLVPLMSSIPKKRPVSVGALQRLVKWPLCQQSCLSQHPRCQPMSHCHTFHSQCFAIFPCVVLFHVQILPESAGTEPGSLPLVPYALDMVMLACCEGGLERTMR